MKYNSTAIDPNGKIPAKKVAGIVFKYHGWNGICLAIWFVFVGCSCQLHFLWAIKEPAIADGNEQINQIKTIKNRVLAGIVPEEWADNKNIFNAIIHKKIKPGTNIGVNIKLAFQ